MLVNNSFDKIKKDFEKKIKEFCDEGDIVQTPYGFNFNGLNITCMITAKER